MKVLITLTYYHPHRTGLTIYVQRLAEGLVKKGHQVTVMTCQHSPDLRPEEVINGVKVVRIPALLRISRGMVMPQFPLYAYRLVKQHDIVVINTPMLEASLVTLMARLMGKKVVITHHGDLVLPAGPLNRFIELCMTIIYRLAVWSADRVIGYSQDYANHSTYLAKAHSKLSVIYPPIDIPLSNSLRAETLQKQLGLDGQRIIGYSGRFVEEKRPDRLLKAIPLIAQRFPNIKLVFAGEYQIKYETFYERCKPLIDQYKDYVLFLGLIKDDQQIADFYTMCDVLALPSATECFALVQVEAMLCGTPVVVNNTPGAREPVRVTGMGEIVDCSDAHILADTITRVIENKPDYLKPRDYIKSIFDTAHTVDQYETLFKQLLGNKEP